MSNVQPNSSFKINVKCTSIQNEESLHGHYIISVFTVSGLLFCCLVHVK